MTVTYTTEAIVKKRLKNIDVDLLTADIEENINQAEGTIDAVMNDSLKTVFDAVKHGIIRQCATDLTAYLCLLYNPGKFTNLSEAELSANLFWNSATRSLGLLSDPRIVTYLKAL